MIPYVLSEDADRDLDAIWDYIAVDSIDAADRWIGNLMLLRSSAVILL